MSGIEHPTARAPSPSPTAPTSAPTSATTEAPIRVWMVGCPPQVCAGLKGWVLHFRFLIRDAWEEFASPAMGSGVEPGCADGPDAWVIGWDRDAPMPWPLHTGSAGTRTRAAAVFLVPAGTSVRARMTLLEEGADDCLVLPVFLPELLARLRLAVRRRREALDLLSSAPATGAPVLTHGHIRVDPGRALAWCHDKPVSVSPREAELLALLVEHRGSCVSRSRLAWQLRAGAAAWPGAGRRSPPDIDSAISVLRGKLAAAGCRCRLLAVPGHGYRLCTDAAATRLQASADVLSR